MAKRGTPNHRKGKGAAIAWLREHVTYQGDDCLTWPFSVNRGYGHFGFEGRLHKAHRFMCELMHGPAPSAQHHAAHECGRGHLGCVNPRHLSWKTSSENAIDRRLHGAPEGSKGQIPALTNEQVAEIRALKGRLSQVKIAQKFGVSRGCVEYWHRHERPPHQPSNAPNAAARRYGHSARSSANQ